MAVPAQPHVLRLCFFFHFASFEALRPRRVRRNDGQNRTTSEAFFHLSRQGLHGADRHEVLVNSPGYGSEEPPQSSKRPRRTKEFGGNAMYCGRFLIHSSNQLLVERKFWYKTSCVRKKRFSALGRLGFHFGKWCLRWRLSMKRQNLNLCSLAASLQCKVLHFWEPLVPNHMKLLKFSNLNTG